MSGSIETLAGQGSWNDLVNLVYSFGESNHPPDSFLDVHRGAVSGAVMGIGR